MNLKSQGILYWKQKSQGIISRGYVLQVKDQASFGICKSHFAVLFWYGTYFSGLLSTPESVLLRYQPNLF